MRRLFDEHIIRKTRTLDGAWKFKCDKGDVGKGEEWFSRELGGEAVTVPSVWNSYKDYLTYEGAFWYEKKFYNQGGTLRLVFEGVMTECEAWLDGEYLGYHYGGFSAFDFIIPDTRAGEARLTLRVDNRFNEKSIPQAYVDWYHYGGITRSVSAEWLEGIAILESRLDYTLSPDLKNAKCSFCAELYAAADAADEISVTLDGGEVVRTAVTMKRGERMSLAFPEFDTPVELWSPKSPRLYTVRISSSSDDLYDRTGFRKIEIKDGKPHLNGEEIEFLGINRHEDHPECGMAFPPSLMRRDLELAFEMGCNIIRGSHYPNAKEFLDLCDERGMLFGSEIPIWGVGFKEAVLADADVEERGLTMHREMLAQYFNHPAIVIWGMHNETPTHTEPVYNLTKRYREFIDSKDTSRLVVFASHRPLDDICFEFSDIACVNQYFGWYPYNYADNSWERFLDLFTARLDGLGFPNKPIAISEFGAAALYGTHDGEDILWSEEYQANLISNCLELFHSTPRVVGSFIWQFADMRTSREAGLNRARSFNNKGIMNEHRKPKLAFREVKRLYNSFKM